MKKLSRNWLVGVGVIVIAAAIFLFFSAKAFLGKPKAEDPTETRTKEEAEIYRVVFLYLLDQRKNPRAFVSINDQDVSADLLDSLKPWQTFPISKMKRTGALNKYLAHIDPNQAPIYLWLNINKLEWINPTTVHVGWNTTVEGRTLKVVKESDKWKVTKDLGGWIE